MKRTAIILVTLVLISSMFFGCSKSSSASQAQVVQGQMNNMMNETMEVMSTPSAQVLMYSNIMTFPLMGGVGIEIKDIVDFPTELVTAFQLNRNLREDFIWEEWVGTWEYDDIDEWVRTLDTPTDRIRILTDYVDLETGEPVACYFDILEMQTDEFENLTNFAMELYVNEVKEMNLEVEAEWNEDDMISMTMNGFMNPYTLALTMTDDNFIFEIKEGNALVYKITLNMELMLVYDEEWGEENWEPVITYAKIEFSNIAFELENFDEEPAENTDIGNFYMDGEKAGDIIAGEIYIDEFGEEAQKIYIRLDNGEIVELDGFLSFV
ncbi:MAG: hypothetical protein PHR06_03275 [Candidatus Cloacimonetes bacterium]|nr:hypothetical protein [Candidatus Cloacimonadota bacterium]